MNKKLLYYSFFVCLGCAMLGCNNNKIACPTYASSFPESNKKKKGSQVAGLPDTNAPVNGKHKSRSVMPGDGPNKRTKLPN